MIWKRSERLPIALILGAFLLPWATAVYSQTASDNTPHDTRIAGLIDMLGRTQWPTTAAISPDGAYVAWTLEGQDGAEMHLTSLAAEGPAQNAGDRLVSPDTAGNIVNNKPGLCEAGWPAWSPDGKQLAFFSNCEQKSGATKKDPVAWQTGSQYQIFVWELRNNSIRQLTHLRGEVSSLSWSPDGKKLGFLFVENATRDAGALSAMKPWSGVIGEDGIEVQSIGTVAVTSDDAVPRLGHPIVDQHVYEFSWSPDSMQIVFIAAPPPGENNWWVAKLYLLRWDWSGDSAHATTQELLDPQKTAGPLHGLQIAAPRFSPDGKQIAFIGGLMSDQGATGGDVYVIATAGGEPKNITPGRAASVTSLDWRSDGLIGIAEHVGGDSHLAVLDLTTGKDIESSQKEMTFPERIGSGGDAMSVSIATKGKGEVAFIRSSYDHPPEVWAGTLTNLKQISHLNDSLKPSWGKAESIAWENEGFHVQGWLLYPTNYDPAKKYPLVVEVHGGPSSAVVPHWPGAGYGGTPFSALGYFVFFPNPRGSFGQGEKFTQANVRDFGYGDLRDILAGMDVLEKRFPIDKNREGLTGWSYGGFMTMFGVTQTTRFRAAVAGAGISDWKSYYGENSIDQWMIPFFGASVYDDPAIYAKSSAIEAIKQVKTPTLLVVGDRDGECPAPQSFEFWHALRAEGVKTQLVVYPNEGHRFVNTDHNRDVLERALRWFETEMPKGGD